MKNENDEFKQYSLSSLRNARNALTRELNEHGRYIDLTTDPIRWKGHCEKLP